MLRLVRVLLALLSGIAALAGFVFAGLTLMHALPGARAYQWSAWLSLFTGLALAGIGILHFELLSLVLLAKFRAPKGGGPIAITLLITGVSLFAFIFDPLALENFDSPKIARTYYRVGLAISLFLGVANGLVNKEDPA